LVYTRRDNLRPQNLAAQEFFPISQETDLIFEKRNVNSLPYFLILLILYSVKVMFLVRLQAGTR
jgi:hypothetical protein